MPMNRVAEAISANNIALKTLVRSRASQQFFFDEKTKTIKSQQWKGYSLNIYNSGNSNNLQLLTTNARWFQMFKYRNNQIINEKGKIVEVQGNQDRENANIGVTSNNRRTSNQKWNVVYANQMPAPLKDGEWSKKFGMRHNKHFYISSSLPSARYVDVVNGKMVIKTRNGQSSQKWFYDDRTKTIKNV
jgi:hypothetical protein